VAFPGRRRFLNGGCQSGDGSGLRNLLVRRPFFQRRAGCSQRLSACLLLITCTRARDRRARPTGSPGKPASLLGVVRRYQRVVLRAQASSAKWFQASTMFVDARRARCDMPAHECSPAVTLGFDQVRVRLHLGASGTGPAVPAGLARQGTGRAASVECSPRTPSPRPPGALCYLVRPGRRRPLLSSARRLDISVGSGRGAAARLITALRDSVTVIYAPVLTSSLASPSTGSRHGVGLRDHERISRRAF